MSSAVQIGDMDRRNSQRFTCALLQTIAMAAGHWRRPAWGPWQGGTVTASATLSPGRPLLLATVAWADGDSTRVNVFNLERQPGTVPVQGR